MSSSFQKFISSKIFAGLGSLLLIFVLITVVRQFKEKRQVEQEISSLSTQADSLQQKNQDLHNLLSYLQTDDYKEKAARQQLNLKRDGEVVFSFADQPDASGQSSDLSQSSVQNQSLASNPRNWWNYFFNPIN